MNFETIPRTVHNNLVVAYNTKIENPLPQTAVFFCHFIASLKLSNANMFRILAWNTRFNSQLKVRRGVRGHVQ